MSDEQTTTEVPVLSWDEQASEVPVRSEQELLETLHDIAANAGDAPPLVEMHHRDGSTLLIGLGRDYSVANYIRSVDEPDYLSKGTVEMDEPPCFYYHGHHSEFAPGSAIPVDEAVEAMLRYYRTGQRPENIDWHQD